MQFSDNNATVSTLNLVPMAEDHEKYLVCRAENPRVPNAVIEDRWFLNVQCKYEFQTVNIFSIDDDLTRVH